MSGHPPRNGLFGAVKRAYTRKWSFLVAFTVMLFLTFGILSALGLTPEETEEAKLSAETRGVATTVEEVKVIEEPIRIEVPDIDLKTKVNNPVASDPKTLDAALLTGAVRYPTSARLGEEGNVILFGHSSYLPVVHNQSYKAFNAIQELKKGDRITVYGQGYAYVYAVDGVYQADAKEDSIPLTDEGYTLTLVTCDSFATKSDRFIVTATLVERYPTAN